MILYIIHKGKTREKCAKRFAIYGKKQRWLQAYGQRIPNRIPVSNDAGIPAQDVVAQEELEEVLILQLDRQLHADKRPLRAINLVVQRLLFLRRQRLDILPNLLLIRVLGGALALPARPAS